MCARMVSFFPFGNPIISRKPIVKKTVLHDSYSLFFASALRLRDEIESLHHSPAANTGGKPVRSKHYTPNSRPIPKYGLSNTPNNNRRHGRVA